MNHLFDLLEQLEGTRSYFDTMGQSRFNFPSRPNYLSNIDYSMNEPQCCFQRVSRSEAPTRVASSSQTGQTSRFSQFSRCVKDRADHPENIYCYNIQGVYYYLVSSEQFNWDSYVILPQGHPDTGLSLEQIKQSYQVQSLILDGMIAGHSSNGSFIGFSSVHPKYYCLMREYQNGSSEEHLSYLTFDYIRKQTEMLAIQVSQRMCQQSSKDKIPKQAINLLKMFGFDINIEHEESVKRCPFSNNMRYTKRCPFTDNEGSDDCCPFSSKEGNFMRQCPFANTKKEQYNCNQYPAFSEGVTRPSILKQRVSEGSNVPDDSNSNGPKRNQHPVSPAKSSYCNPLEKYGYSVNKSDSERQMALLLALEDCQNPQLICNHLLNLLCFEANFENKKNFVPRFHHC